jgi:hypothetical protein
VARLGSFVPRLIALTVIWLLATAALTYAAAQRTAVHTQRPSTTTAAAPAAPPLTVPDVRRQAYVFAKGTLSDAGFGWKVVGATRGFPANTVVSQSPAAGTRVVDTGAPLLVLRLSRHGSQLGVPENVSPVAGTRVRLVDLAVNELPAVAPAVHPKRGTAAKKKLLVKKASPRIVKRATNPRPPAFTVAGARREPLAEEPLTVRAQTLLRWLAAHPKATNPNVEHWLYQHAWIVAGARMGWWHGAAALHILIAADHRVWSLWGIGARSEAVAKQALAEVEARTS